MSEQYQLGAEHFFLIYIQTQITFSKKKLGVNLSQGTIHLGWMQEKKNTNPH